MENEVRFVIIGGRAVQFYGHQRPAPDLDLFVEFSAENWIRLGSALRPLNAGIPRFDELSAKKKYQAKLRFYPTVEFLTAIHGVSFDEAWADGVERIVVELPLRIISKAHLIVSKKTGARATDANDIKALEALS